MEKEHRTVRYLEVTFNTRMSFGAHVEQVVERAKSSADRCSMSEARAAKRPVPLYGVPVSCHALLDAKYRGMLNRVQRRALLGWVSPASEEDATFARFSCKGSSGKEP